MNYLWIGRWHRQQEREAEREIEWTWLVWSFNITFLFCFNAFISIIWSLFTIPLDFMHIFSNIFTLSSSRHQYAESFVSTSYFPRIYLFMWATILPLFHPCTLLRVSLSLSFFHFISLHFFEHPIHAKFLASHSSRAFISMNMFVFAWWQNSYYNRSMTSSKNGKKYRQSNESLYSENRGVGQILHLLMK